MKEKESSFESYMRGDLLGQINEIKELLSNLTVVVSFVYNNLATDKEVDMGMLGLTIYVQESIKEELDIITEMLETV